MATAKVAVKHRSRLSNQRPALAGRFSLGDGSTQGIMMSMSAIPAAAIPAARPLHKPGWALSVAPMMDWTDSR